MSKKTLTDELQSVLLSHSFDAPEPAVSIDKILNATMRGEASAQPVADASEVAATNARHKTGLRRHLTPTVIGVAATVAALVVGVAVLNGTRHDTGNGTTKSASSAGADAPMAGAGQGTVAAPRMSRGSAGVGADTPPVPTSKCPVGQRSSATAAPLNSPDSSAPTSVVTAECLLPSGERTGSEVSVYRTVAGQAQLVAPLIRRTDQLDVDYVALDGNQIKIQGVSHKPGLAGVPVGSIVDVRFATTKGRTFIRTNPTDSVVALPCTTSDLKVSVTKGPAATVQGQQVDSAIISLQNTTVNPCALEGYPTVVPLGPGLKPTPANTTLHGALGGVTRSTEVPIVQLTPNGLASAMLEAGAADTSNGSTSCSAATGLRIGLPGPAGLTKASELGTFGFRIGTCDLQVHPFVGGTTGSG
ncbi:MAG TPA: DUF4232 domain-containing protein [Jatrophihabitans sp.]|jgi:hypothetical protein